MSFIHSNNFDVFVTDAKQNYELICSNYKNITDYVLNYWMNDTNIYDTSLIIHNKCNNIINKDYVLDVNNTGLYIIFYLSIISFTINCVYNTYKFARRYY